MVLLQVLLVAGLASLLAVLGRYGWQNAARLVPNHLDAEGSLRKERALRRGAAMCFVVAMVLVGAAVTSAVVVLTQ